MIFRTFDPSNLNRIANLPAIKEMIFASNPKAQRCYFDYHDAIEQTDRWVVITDGDDAVAMIEMKTPVVFDGHFIFGPSCRGFKAIRIGRAMIDWLFDNTDMLMLVGETPTVNRPASCMAKKIGMSGDGIRGGYEYHHFLRSEWETSR